MIRLPTPHRDKLQKHPHLGCPGRLTVVEPVDVKRAEAETGERQHGDGRELIRSSMQGRIVPRREIVARGGSVLCDGS